MQKGKNREMLGTGKVGPLIVKMAYPAIIAQLITTFYNLVDTYFVSKLGTNATAAVGVNNSLERAITMVAMLIGAGACSYIARLLGMRRDGEANQVMSTSFTAAFGIGVVITVLGKIFLSPLVDFLGATPECRQYSIEYGTYVLYAAPFLISSFVLNMVLRSEGASKLAMIGMATGGILNCFLDPLFIFTFDLGVTGASIATAISKVVSFVILIMPYVRKRTAVLLSPKFIRLKMEHAKEVISIGMASFLRSITNVVALIILNRVAGSYSTSALAAISISTRVMMFPFSAVLGFGQGFQPVIGYNWGAKKYDRVMDSMKFAVKVAVIGGLALGAVIFVLARPLVSIFNSAGDPDIYKYACLAMRVEACTMFIHVGGMIVNMFYAGIGRPLQATLISTARQGYCYIPLLFILPALFGIEGLCVAQGAAEGLTVIIVAPLLVMAIRIIEKARASKA